jgi:carboxylesterase
MKAYDRTHFDHACCKPFYFEGNGHGILLIHGFTGSVAHMRPLGDALQGRGYTVRGINLPGHALDEEAMGATDWKAWLQAAKEATLEMRQACRTVTVCGLSMGGLLALLVAEQMKPDACVTISTPMATRNRMLPMARLAAPFYPRVAWRSQGQRHEGLDPAYDYGYSGFPTKSAGDLHRLIHLARHNLFAINCPVLCVQSEADETVWAESADYILAGVASASRQKLWLKGVPHVCTISTALPAIVDAVDQLLIQVKKEAEGADGKARTG